MRYLMVLMLFCLTACDQFKGKDGAQGSVGSPAVVYSKEYTGTPTANPHYVYLAKDYNSETDIINVYKVTSSGIMEKVPMTIGDWTDYYMLNDNSKLMAIATVGNPSPTIAFKDILGNINTYQIIHKRFNSPSACIAYKRSVGNLGTDNINTLIYGRTAF